MNVNPATRRLKISVMRDRYPTSFCTPRISRHELRPSLFLPTHRVSHRLEGITVMDARGADLIHTMNRIPIGTTKPFVISFESHLPRYFGGELTKLFDYERRLLISSKCKRIVAYSKCALKAFLETHRGTDGFEELNAKSEVVYPNIHLPEWNPEPSSQDRPLTLIFVGAHFARKGGAVTVRAAEIARERKLPLQFHIISSLSVGGRIWSDPKRDDFFAPYLKLLSANNVRFDTHLKNDQVLDNMRQADFSVLATLSDTFGYSAIESLSVGTPVIATEQGALPEFVEHEKNGLILPLETDAFGEWIHIGRSDKDSRRYEALYQSEIEALSHSLIAAVTPYCVDRQSLVAMRTAARSSAERLFDTRLISPRLDMIYDKSCAASRTIVTR